METLTREMRIFSYRTSPIVGWEGEDGGFSLELYGNGNLRYCRYKLFDDIRLMQMFKVDRETVYGIYELIEGAKLETRKIPRELNNGSVDGWLNEFYFIGQDRIAARNIKSMIPQLAMLTRHGYYEKYKKNIEYENQLLKLFHEICKILKVQGIELKLDSCRIRKDFKLKVTW